MDLEQMRETLRAQVKARAGVGVKPRFDEAFRAQAVEYVRGRQGQGVTQEAAAKELGCPPGRCRGGTSRCGEEQAVQWEGRRRRRAKALFFDGTGLCLFSKRLERGRFAALWKHEVPGVPVQLAHSQLALFFEGSELVGRAAGRRRLPPDAPPWHMHAAMAVHLAQEKNVERLRQAALLLEAENARLD